MSPTVRIPLDQPLIGHGDPVRAIVLRAPTYDDYVNCGGEPYVVGETPEGTMFSTEKADVIWAYAQACMVEPKDPLLLSQLGPGQWRVAREVRKAVLDFFQAPAVAAEPSPTSSTTSSSS